MSNSRQHFMKHTVSLAVAFAAISLCSAAHAAGDANVGKTLYQARCTACHAPDHNGVGPAHRGVVGRAAGKVPAFAYSPALRATGLTWNESTLDRWLADPEKLVPGQTMGVNVTDAQERSDLIAYLKQLSKKE
jgi:cytochrome c